MGFKGSMGKRYGAILRYLGHTFKKIDLDTPKHEAEWNIKNSTHLIIATPTDIHDQNIVESVELNKDIRILCEKPVVTNLSFLHTLSEYDITMQMQYTELTSPSDSGFSQYNYFNHGKDGIVWDCFQVIALAKGEVKIFEDSPIWSCDLNGRSLRLSDMDMAYVKYTDKWLKGYKSDLLQLKDWHQKVSEYDKKYR
jgi:hypothetical protein